ncbi:MAG: thioredoxin [Halobacteriales archaeon]|nr:thioredoxin [Halobacteriales archaeon]
MTDDELAEIRAQKRQELLEDDRSTPETTAESTTPDSPIYLDDQSAFAETIETHDVVLVDFYADWCGPCQMLEPTVESIAETTDAAVLKVDIDAYQGLAQQYQVRSVPTMLLFADGEPVERVVGVKPEPALRELISGYTA